MRQRGARLLSACARPLLTWALIAAMPVSIFSKTKACCSSSSVAAELFRSSAEPGAVESLQDLRQSLARIDIGIAGLEIGDFVLQSSGVGRFLGHGKYHGLQRVSRSFGRLRSGGVINPTRAHLAPLLLPFQAAGHFAAVLLPNNLRRLDAAVRTRFQSIPSTSAINRAAFSCTR